MNNQPEPLYFIDLEFIERGPKYPIEMISIGIVSSDDREYYAVSTEFNPHSASEWVKENVLPHLPPKFHEAANHPNPNAIRDSLAWKPLNQIAADILEFVEHLHPEFWGEWCSYDWVVFCQIFNTMMDLPKGFPMRCRDIIQYSEDQLGIKSDKLPPSLETNGNHHALLGAKTVKMRYEWLREQAGA